MQRWDRMLAEFTRRVQAPHFGIDGDMRKTVEQALVVVALELDDLESRILSIRARPDEIPGGEEINLGPARLIEADGSIAAQPPPLQAGPKKAS